MYGLWWMLGILALLVGMLFWLDAYAKHRRRGLLDVFAGRNLKVLGLLGVLLGFVGGLAKVSGAEPATMVELQYYFSNRLRWEVLASLRALAGYASAHAAGLLLTGGVLCALGFGLEKLHPWAEKRGSEVPRALLAVRYVVPVISCAFLSNPLAKWILGLEDAHRYIASEGFFLTANPADMWHFHSLAIYFLCLLVPYCVLKYWARMARDVKTGLVTLPAALAVSLLLIVLLRPLAGVMLYPVLICFTLAVVFNCFDIQAAKKKRAARYTKRENELIDLLSLDLAWAEEISPAEARALADKMEDNGDSGLTGDIYAALKARGQED